jgi:hypothetical protein
MLSWRSLAWRPALAGLDSWQAGITLGFVDHLQWGPQLVFTFGPYGFVEDILPFSHLTAAVGFVYALGVIWGLAALIISALRPSWGLLPAGVAAWVALGMAANMVEAPELGIALALGLALASLRAGPDGATQEWPWTWVGSQTAAGAPPAPAPAHALPLGPAPLGPAPVGSTPLGSSERWRLALLALLGAFAGLQLLVEIDVGLVSAMLAVLAVAGHTRRGPALAGAGGAFVGVVVVAMVAAGQSLGNLPSYIHGSVSVLLGYAPAMSSSNGRVAEDWYAVVDIALIAAVYALALRHRPRPERAALGVALVGWVWEALKEGFVRHDKHDLIFFALVVVALCVARVPRLAVLQAIAIVVAALLALLANGWIPRAMHSPIEDVTALAQGIRDLAVPGRWAPIEREARVELRDSGDTLSPPLLASLRGHTVAAVPLEDGLSFAYPELHWDPVPVLQGYSAYTSYLDELDGRFLGSARAPDYVLYRPGTIDGRNPVWDPPTAFEAMLCHYAATGESDGWLVLTRVTDRCGPPHLIDGVTAHFGQVVRVPPAPGPGEMVVATFSIRAPLAAEVEGLLLKPPMVQLTADQTTYRFITGTAPDDHVLSVPTAKLGYPASAAPPAVRRVQLSGGGWAPGQGVVGIRFYAVGLARR